MTAPTSLTPAERETILNLDDETGVVRIWTAQRTVITALRKRAAAGVQEIASGHHGTTEWAEFTFDTGADGAGAFNLGRAFAKRPTLSPEQRAASAERMRRVRGARPQPCSPSTVPKIKSAGVHQGTAQEPHV